MKPFIILCGNRYYPGGWDDYAGEAETIEEATAIAEKAFADPERYAPWYEIVDLRIKQVVLARRDEDPAYDPRSS